MSRIKPIKCCGRIPHRRKANEGIFKFKYLRCPGCGKESERYILSSDDTEMISDWNAVMEKKS